MEAAFDFIGDVGDDLYRTSAKVSTAFFLKNSPVNFTGSYVGIFSQALINETFIMSKVKISLCTVIGYKNLSMLNGVPNTVR